MSKPHKLFRLLPRQTAAAEGSCVRVVFMFFTLSPLAENHISSPKYLIFYDQWIQTIPSKPLKAGKKIQADQACQNGLQ
jgi:hypothetical protein